MRSCWLPSLGSYSLSSSYPELPWKYSTIPRLTLACQQREQRSLEDTHMQACPVTASRVLSLSREAEGRPLAMTAGAFWMMGRAYLCKVHGQEQSSQGLCKHLRCPLEYSGSYLQKYRRGSIRDGGVFLVTARCP